MKLRRFYKIDIFAIIHYFLTSKIIEGERPFTYKHTCIFVYKYRDYFRSCEFIKAGLLINVLNHVLVSIDCEIVTRQLCIYKAGRGQSPVADGVPPVDLPVSLVAPCAALCTRSFDP